MTAATLSGAHGRISGDITDDLALECKANRESPSVTGLEIRAGKPANHEPDPRWAARTEDDPASGNLDERRRLEERVPLLRGQSPEEGACQCG